MPSVSAAEVDSATIGRATGAIYTSPMPKKKALVTDKLLQELRAFGLAYPGAQKATKE